MSDKQFEKILDDMHTLMADAGRLFAKACAIAADAGYQVAADIEKSSSPRKRKKQKPKAIDSRQQKP